MLDVNKTWTISAGSSGSGERVDGHNVLEWTFYVETAAGCTCTAFIMSAQSTNSSSVGQIISSTAGINLGASETAIAQFTGPFAAVWPRVSDKTNNGVVKVRAVAVG